VDDARLLFESMTTHQRSDRVLARAAIARALSRTDAAGALAQLSAALDDATKGGIIESGGEEVEALAVALGEMAEHAMVSPDHPLVAEALSRMQRLRNVKIDQRDQKSWGYSRAALATANAASRSRAGWLDVALAIQPLVWSEDLAKEVAAAVARARMRVDGGNEPPAQPTEKGEPRAPETIDLEELREETKFARRARTSTRAMAGALARGDLEAARRALTVAIAPTARSLPNDEFAALSSELAVSLLEGDERGREEGQRKLGEVMKTLPLEGGSVSNDLRVAAAIDRALSVGGAATSSRAAWVRRLVNDAIDAGLPASHRAGGMDAEDEKFVAESLGRAVAQLDEPELEARLLQAASVVGEYEDREGSEAGERRARRIERTLEGLAAARTEREIEAPLPTWRVALGKTWVARRFLKAAAGSSNACATT
jgi:hypothetical protein